MKIISFIQMCKMLIFNLLNRKMEAILLTWPCYGRLVEIL